MGNQIVIVDRQSGKLQKAKPITFAELGLKERKDLEEWIKENIDILGSDLLILTSEYDKFDKSDKRLDLLALDRGGKVVVIELKRDAARTLADLQAIRYAAFCSTLTLEVAVELRSKFARVDVDTARREIQDFIEDPSFSTLDNKPRIILAAGSFNDQELTSCVLWLRDFGVDIRCVEVTPYRLGDAGQLILVPRVIIPLPQAEEYIVQVEKKAAYSNIAATRAEELRLSFWNGFVDYCKREGTFLALRKPAADLWYGIAIGRANIHISLTFKVAQNVLGCELHLRNTRSKDAFEELEKQKAAIEAELRSASALQWDPPSENGRRGRIAEFRTADLKDRKIWPELYAWLKERAETFHKAFSPRVKTLKLETGEQGE